MVVSSFLNCLSQRYFTPSVVRIEHFLSVFCQHALESEDWRSNLATPESRQVRSATITSKNTMVTRLKRYLSDITSACNCKYLQKDRIFHPLGYERIPSRCQSLATEYKISKAKEIPKIKQGYCANFNLMTSWRSLMEGEPFTIVKVWPFWLSERKTIIVYLFMSFAKHCQSWINQLML